MPTLVGFFSLPSLIVWAGFSACAGYAGAVVGDTSRWHDDRSRGAAGFLRGRVQLGRAESGAPFPSALVVLRNAPRHYEMGVGDAG